MSSTRSLDFALKRLHCTAMNTSVHGQESYRLILIWLPQGASLFFNLVASGGQLCRHRKQIKSCFPVASTASLNVVRMQVPHSPTTMLPVTCNRKLLVTEGDTHARIACTNAHTCQLFIWLRTRCDCLHFMIFTACLVCCLLSHNRT